MYVFVAATALRARREREHVSAARASSELGSVRQRDRERAARACGSTYSTTSGVCPDCERATTTELERSNVAP